MASPLTKVIVLGLDGFDPRLAGRLLDRGELPHLARLQASGGFTSIATTSPAQTPVAWSTVATGTNPGGHGIFDFIRRDPTTYLPDLALNRFHQKNAFLPPKVVNLRGGTPFWDILSEAGVRSTILRCPCTFPPDKIRGRMLSGMGVPDARGGLGTPTFYTTRADVTSGESEQAVPLTLADDQALTAIIGPRHPKTRADIECPLSLAVDRVAGTVRLEADGQAVTVAQGRWSDWLHVKFKTGMLQALPGMVRFLLVRLEPDVEVYASPVNFDPQAMLLYPISSPPEYAKELARAVGTYYTTGMVEDHGGLNNGRFSEEAYLEQCRLVMEERERMFHHELDRADDGVVYCLFDTPDRLQHMFWRFREPDHPANRGGASSGYEDAIDRHYRECDAVVGRAWEYVDDRTLFLVLSDHGFGSFRRGLNLNTWLREEGLLTLRHDAEGGEFFEGVDWSRTQAYALGLGSIYLNLQGREAQGIVSPSEAPSVVDRIQRGLSGLVDRETGTTAVRRVAAAADVYAGPYLADAPDAVVHFAAGYRASWGTALGGVPAAVFEDNTKRWSGDHIVDPVLVPGACFLNRPFDPTDADLRDIAPTILAAFDVPPGPAMEGKVLTT